MEQKASVTAEEMTLLKAITENEGIRALLLEELDQVSGGLQAVYDYYHETLHVVMNNLDQCITQEEWDRYK